MNDHQHLISDIDISIVVPKRILVFAGHPDDEIISCGGTLLKYQELGSKIIIVVSTSGLGGYAKESQKSEIMKQRHEELIQVKKVLICEIIELNFENMEITGQKISIPCRTYPSVLNKKS